MKVSPENSDKGKGDKNNEKPLLQMTSGQIILTVASLIFIGACCIVLGMFLGNGLPSSSFSYFSGKNSQLVEVNKNTEISSADKKTTEVNSDKNKMINKEISSLHGEGTQVSPRPVKLPDFPSLGIDTKDIQKVAAPSPEEIQEISSNFSTSDDKKISYSPLPFSTSEEKSPGDEAGENNKIKKFDGKEYSNKNKVYSNTNKKESVNSDGLGNIQKVSHDSKKGDVSSKTVTSIEKKDKNIRKKGSFAVQLRAVSASKRSQAEQFVKENSSLPLRIELSPDKKWLRILYGNFSSRSDAQKKCEELRKNKKYSDCFVQKIN